ASLALKERLSEEHPEVPDYRTSLANSHHNLGALYRATGRMAEAEASYQAALTLQERLSEEHPEVLVNLLSSYSGRATALDQLGRHAEAAEDWGRALEVDDGSFTEMFRSNRFRSLTKAGAIDVAADEILSAFERVRAGGEDDPGPLIGVLVGNDPLFDRVATVEFIEQLVRWEESQPGADLQARIDRYLGLARGLRNRGRTEEAETLLALVLDRAEEPWQLESARLLRANRFGPGRPDDPEAPPSVPMTIEAPFRAASPIADGRIEPGEYWTGTTITFDSESNPGRLLNLVNAPSTTTGWFPYLIKSDPADLSYTLHAAHSTDSLFLAFKVRDQFIDDQEVDAAAPFFNDDVELFLNGDLVANDLIPEMAFDSRGNREGFQLVADVAGRQVTASTDFGNEDWSVATARTEDGYIVEFEIPLGLIDTRDGPEVVPASTGSFLLMNVTMTDNDKPVSQTTNYATLWNPGVERGFSPYLAGEDTWLVGLSLTPSEETADKAPGSEPPPENAPQSPDEDATAN
ncbi:tetratricopeptide repeat protein, partial [Tautonia rosea]|uniref:tetratricopeptide repeat protein n=1 Tax=Tautonia rosea TaxID=2728037 RepID=UPI0014740130